MCNYILEIVSEISSSLPFSHLKSTSRSITPLPNSPTFLGLQSNLSKSPWNILFLKASLSQLEDIKELQMLESRQNTRCWRNSADQSASVEGLELWHFGWGPFFIQTRYMSGLKIGTDPKCHLSIPYTYVARPTEFFLCVISQLHDFLETLCLVWKRHSQWRKVQEAAEKDFRVWSTV